MRQVQRNNRDRSSAACKRRSTRRETAGEQQVITGRKIDPPQGLATDRYAALVQHDRSADTRGAKSGDSCTKAEIEVLEAEKILFCEQPDALDDFPFDEHRTAAHAVHVAKLERRQCRPQRAIPVMPHAARRGGIRYAQRLHRVWMRSRNEYWRYDSEVRTAAEHVFQRTHGIGRDDDIAVQQEHTVRTETQCFADTEITTGREAAILDCNHQLRAWKLTGQQIRRPVLRTIVDDDDGRKRTMRSLDGAYRANGIVGRPVIQDHRDDTTGTLRMPHRPRLNRWRWRRLLVPSHEIRIP